MKFTEFKHSKIHSQLASRSLLFPGKRAPAWQFGDLTAPPSSATDSPEPGVFRTCAAPRMHTQDIVSLDFERRRSRHVNSVWKFNTDSYYNIYYYYYIDSYWELAKIYLSSSFKSKLRVPIVAQQKRIRLGTMRLQVQSLASLSRLRIWCCHELWCRLQMWLGSGIAVVVTQVGVVQPLAWEPPYAVGGALKRPKKQNGLGRGRIEVGG